MRRKRQGATGMEFVPLKGPTTCHNIYCVRRLMAKQCHIQCFWCCLLWGTCALALACQSHAHHVARIRAYTYTNQSCDILAAYCTPGSSGREVYQLQHGSESFQDTLKPSRWRAGSRSSSSKISTVVSQRSKFRVATASHPWHHPRGIVHSQGGDLS